MAEYIKRETVTNHLDACMDTIWKPEIVALKCFVEGIPAADVAPVQPGFWEDAPTVAAVPASKILALRDALYEADAVTMRGLRNLNMLIAKYEGGKEK